MGKCPVSLKFTHSVGEITIGDIVEYDEGSDIFIYINNETLVCLREARIHQSKVTAVRPGTDDTKKQALSFLIEKKYDPPLVIEKKYDPPLVIEKKYDPPLVIEKKYDPPVEKKIEKKYSGPFKKIDPPVAKVVWGSGWCQECYMPACVCEHSGVKLVAGELIWHNQ